nr:hypothetical protein Iba_chr08eCG8420 [Ipomoea batatas]
MGTSGLPFSQGSIDLNIAAKDVGLILSQEIQFGSLEPALSRTHESRVSLSDNGENGESEGNEVVDKRNMKVTKNLFSNQNNSRPSFSIREPEGDDCLLEIPVKDAQDLEDDVIPFEILNNLNLPSGNDALEMRPEKSDSIPLTFEKGETSHANLKDVFGDKESLSTEGEHCLVGISGEDHVNQQGICEKDSNFCNEVADLFGVLCDLDHLNLPQDGPNSKSSKNSKDLATGGNQKGSWGDVFSLLALILVGFRC